MALTSGSRLGAYEILNPLGAGGMGEVYRARDTSLSREVAIKILPDAFAHDAERLARFDREARLLASLHHPHIASIFGLEESDGRKFLVLEFVPGQSLADRLSRGPLPIDEAMRFARQLVDALEAAHERGVIHRDLKPANIMITADDQVKVLDFGLAKQVDDAAAGAGGPGVAGQVSQSPTLSLGATQAGVILGTAAYMSPEQAKGRRADKRSDIWAFGCVLYEMLSGKSAFQGEDISETLAAILRAEPDLAALPATLPDQIRSVIKRCLDKDRKARIPDVAVVRFLLDDHQRSDVGRPDASPTSAMPWKVASAVLLFSTIAAAIAAISFSQSAASPVTRFAIRPPDRGLFTASAGRLAPIPRISPDGRKIAFTSRDEGGKTLLWVQSLDSLEAHALPDTEDAAWPFWSPDSRQIGFSIPGKLMKIDVNGGGPPQVLTTLATATNVSRGGAWNEAGVIVFSGLRGISRISASGGPASVVAEDPALVADAPPGRGQFFPEFLPDGRHVLFADPTGAELTVQMSTLDTHEMRPVLQADSGAVYERTSGRLLFLRRGTLFAQPFDLQTLTLSGEPVALADHVVSDIVPGAVTFSASRNGILAYGTDSNFTTGLQLDWVDRLGKIVGTVGSRVDYRGVDLSPDGTRIAWHDHENRFGGNVWLFQTPQGPPSRLTFDATQDNSAPLWSPDGKWVFFSSLRNGKWSLFRKRADGTGDEERLLESDGTVTASSVTPDGKLLAYQYRARRTADVWLVPLEGDRTPRPLLEAPFQELDARISPNGRWIAYSSDETGKGLEIFVRPFPAGAGKWQISTSGGAFSRWRADSRELFFMNATSSGKMMAASISWNGDALEHGAPTELFDTKYASIGHPGGGFSAFDVSADGQRFLIPRPPISDEYSTGSIGVVLNWTSLLNK